jgi:hypothetical protein
MKTLRSMTPSNFRYWRTWWKYKACKLQICQIRTYGDWMAEKALKDTKNPIPIVYDKWSCPDVDERFKDKVTKKSRKVSEDKGKKK